MLARPRLHSRYSIFVGVIAILAGYLLLDSLWTMNTNTKSYGSRKTYVLINSPINAGSKIEVDSITKKQMFSKDAPPNALEYISLTFETYALVDLPSNIVLTKKMVTKNYDTIDRDKRLIFVPSDIALGKKENRTDLIATTEYGSDIVAENATILRQEDTKNKGYFVLVNSDEAAAIAESLAKGEVYFSIFPYK